jgi:hypothetical protein
LSDARIAISTGAGITNVITSNTDETTVELLVKASTADGRTNGSIPYSTKAG